MSTEYGTHDYGRFDELAEEYAERYRRGERPSVEEYVCRLPAMADEIREMFPALVEVERVEGDAREEALEEKRSAFPRLEELGNYRIVREIGRGGMGVVYEAEQLSLGRQVALKILPQHVAADRTALARFRREAKAAARLHHTNIVPVFEVGQEGEFAFYAMQFIKGQGLDQVIDELRRLRGPDPRPVEEGRARPVDLTGGRHSSTGIATTILMPVETETLDRPAPTSAVLPGGTSVSSVNSSGRRPPFFRSVARIGRQAAYGLGHAHSRGVVHRDIKPSNLLLDADGVVWITDFGLAKAEDDGLTATGDIVGTLRYMAPERFQGEGDARADIYALGLTLYELLTLRPAFLVRDRLTLIARIKTVEPAPPRSLDARIPRDLETIVLKAIEKDPRKRYPSADALAEDLRRFLDDEPIQARRASAVERSARWARHHPLVPVLGAVLLLTTVASLLVAHHMGRMAGNEHKARAAAQDETYRAILSEARALRAGHQPGWRAEALGDLARLAVMPTPRRDLTELRTEAAAVLKTPDIQLVAEVEVPADDLSSFAFSPDGRTLLTAGQKTGLEFWDLTRMSYLSSAKDLTVGELRLDKVLYLSSSQGLAVGTRDRGVVFADMRGNCTDRTPITRGSSQPIKLASNADGRRIAVAWTGGAGITVHDAFSGRLLDRFEEPSLSPEAAPFALSPDGQWLAHQEGTDIVLRPVATGQAPIVLARRGAAHEFSFSPDGALLAVAFHDHTTMLWDLARRELFGTLRGHRERVLDVAFSPDGEWIATASLDYTARIWETRTGQCVATLPDIFAVRRVKWSPTGEYLATRTNSPRQVCLYRITGRNGVQQWLRGHHVELGNVAAHPCRQGVLTSGYTELMSWDLSLARPFPVVMEPNPGWVTGLAYSPDGSLLATASWKLAADHQEAHLLIRDAETSQTRSRISPRRDVIWALAFDPGGRRLATGDNEGLLVVWDLVTGRPVWQFTTGSAQRSIVVLDRPRGLVTHGKDSVLVFDLETGDLRRKVELRGGEIQGLIADRLRNRLVIGFQSGAIGTVSLPEFTFGPSLENAHTGTVDRLALSPDGRFLATCGADHRVVLRDAKTLEKVLEFPVWVGNPRDLTFDLGGRHLVVVGSDSDVDLWDLTALSDGLAEIGLAWDRPPSARVLTAGEPFRPTVRVIRRPKSGR
jgi:serine/threonine protein kinase/WD40 repeat protein